VNYPWYWLTAFFSFIFLDRYGKELRDGRWYFPNVKKLFLTEWYNFFRDLYWWQLYCFTWNASNVTAWFTYAPYNKYFTGADGTTTATNGWGNTTSEDISVLQREYAFLAYLYMMPFIALCVFFSIPFLIFVVLGFPVYIVWAIVEIIVVWILNLGTTTS
tara:strand:+ start:39 stop:518 length:480 start_codon:yes stop_codon:yes gene_type:complete